MTDAFDHVPGADGGGPELQVGVIPYRWQGHSLEVLLVTSRTRGRWIVPKGNIEPDRSPQESARLEAYEEAGVRGRIHPVSLGTYRHGDPPGVDVELFLMEVAEVLDRWPEQGERDRDWMPLARAAQLVDEDGVRDLLPLMAELLY